MSFSNWYDKNHKKILIIPAIILGLAIIYLTLFYIQNGDIIRKDVSLTGGSTITIFSSISSLELEQELSKEFQDFSVTSISDNSGNQIQLAITVMEQRQEDLETFLEDYLGYELDEENSSKETTSASISADFYKQLIIAVLIAFFWMSSVVFLIFSKGKKLKFWIIILNLLFGFFMGNFFYQLNPLLSSIIFFSLTGLMIYIYIKNSVPSFAVMLCAFSDIITTLAIVNLLGIKMSMGGIVAFLMLIGYSVDTDILLTSRLLNKKEETNKIIFNAFKTGTTMTLTSIIAITTALIAVYNFSSVLNQIFLILLIGLFLDIFYTWITNASIIKWYVEKKQ